VTGVALKQLILQFIKNLTSHPNMKAVLSQNATPTVVCKLRLIKRRRSGSVVGTLFIPKSEFVRRLNKELTLYHVYRVGVPQRWRIF
jgi:hypothetical protein